MNNAINYNNMAEDTMLLKRQIEQLQKENRLLQSKLKKKEEDLANLDCRYKTLVNNSIASISIIDKDGYYEIVNQKAALVMGGTVDTIVGRNMTEFLSEEDSTAYLKRNREFIEKGGSETYHREFFIDSKKKFFIILDQVVQGTSGDGVALMSMAIDITENMRELEDKNKELALAEEKFRQLAENSTTIIYKLSLTPHIQFEYINPAVEQLTGYGVEEFYADSSLGVRIIHPDDLHIWEKAQTKMNGEPIVLKWIRKDGRVIWTEQRNVVLYDSYNKPVSMEGSVRDITDIKENEIQLNKQNYEYACLNEEYLTTIEDLKDTTSKLNAEQNLFRELFYENGAVKLIIDPETKLISDANHAASKFYGWDIAELRELRVPDINTLSESEIDEEMKKVSDSNLTRFEFAHIRKNGEIVDVEVFSNLVPISGKNYIYSIIHDVTDKKKLETKANVLSHVVEQSPVAIAVTDKSGVIEYVNSAFEHITEYSPREAIGRTSEFMRLGKNTETDYKEIIATLLAGQAWEGEVINYKKSGGRFWAKKIIFPIFRDSNEVCQYVSITEDISDKKQMEHDLINAKDKAEESDRLKTAFLNNVSHEFRTPMNGILGFTNLLVKSGNTEEKREEYATFVNESCEKLLGIVTDVIEISEVQSGIANIRDEQFSLTDMLNLLIEPLQLKARQKGLQLIYKPIDKNFSVITDRSKLRKCFQHLLNNALNFTHVGQIEVICESKPEQFQITISDTGIGISKEVQKVIYEPFRQAETGITRKFGGNGIGLSLVKAYVEMLGGSISLKSEEDKGTTVCVSLPLHFVNQRIDSPSVNNDDQEVFTGKTILVVEDEELNYLFLKAVLSDTTSELIRARNGKEAVDFCRNYKSIDLILMDLKMPVMNGYEATKLIKEFRADIPIIAQTAHAQEDDIEMISKSGFDDYLPKPFGQKRLIEKIRKHI